MEIIMHQLPERDSSLKSTTILFKKPPLPPTMKQQHYSTSIGISKCDSITKSKGNHIQQKIDDENAQQIHRLIAMNDKLNLELAEVRKSLHLERVGVRELRASHDGEYRKLKNETKKLLDIVGNVKKTAAHHKQKHLVEMTKMSEELATIRDTKNFIEKKLRSCVCSSVHKGVILTKNNNASELKTDQIMANAKAEIKRLLEELKAKDREISELKNQQSKGDQIHSTMKEDSICAGETKSERFVTHVDLTQTGTMMSREDSTSFTAVIKMDENHQHTIVPRLDPNPQPNNSIRTSSNATTIIEVKESMCEGQNQKKIVDTDDQNKSLEFMKNKYTLMRKELFEARSRIEELEENLMEQNNNSMDSNRFQDRVVYLEEREKRLEKETHELREQNELLEFRILELEENQDKWSLRSNLTPDSKDTCNCWREKESDDLMMLSSDSGITSPHSHHYDQQSVSPCSISLMDQIPTDDIRAHISKMSKRSFYNEEDKSCFQQMIMLLNSLEALSHDHNLVGGDDFSSLEYSSVSDKIKSSPSKIPEPVLPPSSHQQQQQPSSPPKHQKIVATVQPYSTNLRSFIEPKKENIELDVAGAAISTLSQETQTETDDTLKTNAELYAEIEKLNRFRKKMEESSKLTNLSSVASIPSTSTAQLGSSVDCDTIERRHLIFYQERMAMLENKIEIFESSGDEQAKLLSKRLEHEVQLASKVNQLQDAVEKLRQKTQELEENNCELEEIENETRLRCQKLEEEFEVMNQRNSELEMTKNCYQDKFEEARDNVEYMEECLQATEERIKALETREKELMRRLQLSSSFIPAVALFQMWKMKKMLLPPMIKTPPPPQKLIEIPEDHPIHQKVLELQTREKQLTQNINDLNRAYQETLENADNLWAQMEKEYKDKISLYEKLEASLRLKVQQLEKRLLRDTEDANDRISSLEETEYQLKNRAGKLNRDLKEQQKKNTELLDELQSAKDENQKLQAYINGPAADNIEREKKKLRRTEEDLQIARNALKDAENAHKNEQILLKRQLQKMHKELKNFEVTNGELREEVETLERRIIELETYHVGDKNRIQELIDELESKSQYQQQNIKPVRAFKQQPSTPIKSLAQELNQKPQPIPRQKTVPIIERCDRTSFAFADAINKFEKNCCEDSSPKRELKSLADCIISNAETNGYVPIKRSFVEEARQKFSKWM